MYDYYSRESYSYDYYSRMYTYGKISGSLASVASWVLKLCNIIKLRMLYALGDSAPPDERRETGCAEGNHSKT